MLTQARLSEISTQLHVAATWLPKGIRANTIIAIAIELDDAAAVGDVTLSYSPAPQPPAAENPYIQDSDTAGAHEPDEDERL